MADQLTHVDLFSGIGGFALAARANGIETVQFVEIDERCRAFLAKAWPGVPIHDDIRTFDGAAYSGRTFLLTGGVPCQPASRAGKQRGAEDDRWLWPAAIRVLADVRPTWALFENPPGIGDVGLAGILAEVAACGYEVRVFGIPACAVGAPHRRMRYWIVAHSENERHQGRDCSGRSEPTGRGGLLSPRSGPCDMADSSAASILEAAAGGADGARGVATSGAGPGDVADAAPSRFGQGSADSRGPREGTGATARRMRSPDGTFAPWDSFAWVPCADGKLRRAPDDSFGLVDGLHRSLLGALGNSIVPQVAERIIAAMVAADSGGEWSVG